MDEKIFYFQTHIATQAICYNPTLVRDKPLGAAVFVRRVYYLISMWGIDQYLYCVQVGKHAYASLKVVVIE